MSDKIETRLKELGLDLPPVPKPLGAYVPAVRTGNLVYISGQGATLDGKLLYEGYVGAELTQEQGYECAKMCGLNALSILKGEIGSLDNVKRIVKVLGFVKSSAGFDRQPLVINGFSELMVAVFGDAGKHARSAVSCNELPFGTPVEVEMIVEVKA